MGLSIVVPVFNSENSLPLLVERLSRVLSPDVQVLARELGINRELLYKWRRIFLVDGAEGLREYGRPKAIARSPASPMVRSETLDGARQRIADLERLVGQQQADLDFFRAVLRRVGARSG